MPDYSSKSHGVDEFEERVNAIHAIELKKKLLNAVSFIILCIVVIVFLIKGSTINKADQLPNNDIVAVYTTCLQGYEYTYYKNDQLIVTLDKTGKPVKCQSN